MSRAGERFAGTLNAGEAVRIFTGAPVPDGADAILIQENARRDGDIDRGGRSLHEPAATSAPPASISATATCCFSAGRVLDPRAISLAASMGHAALPVRRRPRVAILANGDELVPPGTHARAGPDRLVERHRPRRARRGARRRGDRPRHRARQARGDRRLRRPRRRRRHPRHQRRRLGRRARPRAGRAQGPRAEARFLEDRHAAGKAADGRPARRDARARAPRQSGLDLRLRPAFPEAADPRACSAFRPRRTSRPRASPRRCRRTTAARTTSARG